MTALMVKVTTIPKRLSLKLTTLSGVELGVELEVLKAPNTSKTKTLFGNVFDLLSDRGRLDKLLP